MAVNYLTTALIKNGQLAEKLYLAIRGVVEPESSDCLLSDFSVPDAATYLNMSRTTLWRMCDRGEIDSVRRGKKFYIPASEVARLKKVAT